MILNEGNLTRSQFAFAALLVCPGMACAGDWSGQAALGYLATSGNSSARSLNAKAAVDYKTGRWKNAFVASAISSADKGASTAERYAAGDKVDYGFTERDYVFADLEFEKDLFGGIR